MVADALVLARTAPPQASLSQRRATLATLLLGSVFFIATSALAIVRHQAFATGNRDLQIYAQVEWGLANGIPFSTSLLRTNTVHLAEHLALALLPIAPLYGLVPDPRLLLSIQQLALGLAALTAGLWARCRLGPLAGLLILGTFLLNPALDEIGLDDFHAVVLTAFPIALRLVFALARRYRSASLLLLFAAVMEEEVGLVLIGSGLLLLGRGTRPTGLRLIAGGVVLLGLAAFVVMPLFHDART